ncbi:unnamed protein product [Periconia digitata]|uniref:Uncharacterized protein n=1 Tax=Periconia digitata TaxID=1303443 RepID=A0A9W4UDI6_9PLEO|nr:unnamed protein product [Periconia digitata]
MVQCWQNQSFSSSFSIHQTTQRSRSPLPYLFAPFCSVRWPVKFKSKSGQVGLGSVFLCSIASKKNIQKKIPPKNIHHRPLLIPFVLCAACFFYDSFIRRHLLFSSSAKSDLRLGEWARGVDSKEIFTFLALWLLFPKATPGFSILETKRVNDVDRLLYHLCTCVHMCITTLQGKPYLKI